jgi:hypothetical protein
MRGVRYLRLKLKLMVSYDAAGRGPLAIVLTSPYPGTITAVVSERQ